MSHCRRNTAESSRQPGQHTGSKYNLFNSDTDADVTVAHDNVADNGVVAAECLRPKSTRNTSDFWHPVIESE
jgi:hypothetical protein